MLRLLLKKQLTEIFRGYFYNVKTNKARAKSSTILMFALFTVLMVVVLGGIFGSLAYSLCLPLEGAGLGWLYYTILGLLSIFLGVFGSVFSTYSGLYLAKDNDLLLSMPIPLKYIIASRLLSVYLMGLMYSAMVLLPALLIRWVTAPCGVPGVLGGIALLLIVSAFVLLLSCVLGWGVAKISRRLRNKSFITVLASLIFLGAYYFFYFKAQDFLQELLRNAAEYGEKIRSAAYGLYVFGRAGEGDPLSLLLCAVAVLLPGAAVWLLLKRSFLSIATASVGTKRTAYRERALRSRSPFRALLRREFARFTSSANYMLNCGLGVLTLPVGGVLLLIKGKDLVETLSAALGPVRGACIPVLACAAAVLLVSMNDMAAPSVSLEGRQITVVQSLPVAPWSVLKAKLCLQLILSCGPMLFAAACAAAVIPGGIALRLLVVASGLSCAAFLAVFDLTLGVRMPNLQWTSELAPIKQSASVMVALFGSWFYALLIGVPYLFLCEFFGPEIYLAAVTALNAAACFILLRWLKTKGAATFASL